MVLTIKEENRNIAEEYIKRADVLAKAEYDANYRLIITAKDVRNIPCADVVAVKRGQWHDVYLITSGVATGICSYCDSKNFINPDFPYANYCPSCGAKMDGEKLSTWIPRDNWELGYEYDCPYCGESINVPHGGTIPHKCWKCGKEIGVN